MLQGLADNIHSVLLSTDMPDTQQVEEFGFLLCQTYFTMLIVDAERAKNHFGLQFFVDLLK